MNRSASDLAPGTHEVVVTVRTTAQDPAQARLLDALRAAAAVPRPSRVRPACATGHTIARSGIII